MFIGYKLIPFYYVCSRNWTSTSYNIPPVPFPTIYNGLVSPWPLKLSTSPDRGHVNLTIDYYLTRQELVFSLWDNKYSLPHGYVQMWKAKQKVNPGIMLNFPSAEHKFSWFSPWVSNEMHFNNYWKADLLLHQEEAQYIKKGLTME